ncbi:MAG: hypothetical protein KAY59_00720 [Acidobacteria bacterium]|nr:hypothetical protein [Acidobacteriota bacterium]MBP8272918.1 hypothetical protein [Acidobacteriota bacterium]
MSAFDNVWYDKKLVVSQSGQPGGARRHHLHVGAITLDLPDRLARDAEDLLTIHKLPLLVTARGGRVTSIAPPLFGRVAEVRTTQAGLRVRFDRVSGVWTVPRTHPRFGVLQRALHVPYRRAFAFVRQGRGTNIAVALSSRPNPLETIKKTRVRRVDNPRVRPLTAATVRRIFRSIIGERCDVVPWIPAADLPCFPFAYPDGGCDGTAHAICRIFNRESKASAAKIWMFLSKGREVFTRNTPLWHVNWSIHVATLINQDGRDMVVDPGFFPRGAVHLRTWVNRIDPKGTVWRTRPGIFGLIPSRQRGFDIVRDRDLALMRETIIGCAFALSERHRRFAKSGIIGPPFPPPP